MGKANGNTIDELIEIAFFQRWTREGFLESVEAEAKLAWETKERSLR